MKKNIFITFLLFSFTLLGKAQWSLGAKFELSAFGSDNDFATPMVGPGAFVGFNTSITELYLSATYFFPRTNVINLEPIKTQLNAFSFGSKFFVAGDREEGWAGYGIGSFDLYTMKQTNASGEGPGERVHLFGGLGFVHSMLLARVNCLWMGNTALD